MSRRAKLWCILFVAMCVCGSAVYPSEEPANLYNQFVSSIEEGLLPPPLTKDEKRLVEEFKKASPEQVWERTRNRPHKGGYSISELVLLSGLDHLISGHKFYDISDNIKRGLVDSELSPFRYGTTMTFAKFFNILEAEEPPSPHVTYLLLSQLYGFFHEYPTLHAHRRLARIANKLLEGEMGEDSQLLRLTVLFVLLLPQEDSEEDRERVRDMLLSEENIYAKVSLYRNAAGWDGYTFSLVDGGKLIRKISKDSKGELFNQPDQFFYLDEESFPEKVRLDWDAFVAFVEENEAQLYLCHESRNWKIRTFTNKENDIDDSGTLSD